MFLILVREDLLEHTNPKCPVILDYKQTADLDSVYNTPCTVAVYVLGLVLDWIISQGGVKGVNILIMMVVKLIVLFTGRNAREWHN